MKKQGTDIAEDTTNTQPATDTATLLQFELPPVTEAQTDFIGDDVAQVTGNDNTSPTDNQAELIRGQLDDAGQPYDPTLHDYPARKSPGKGKWIKRPKNKPLPTRNDATGKNEPIKTNAAYRQEAQKLAILYANLHRIPFKEAGELKSETDLMPLITDLERYFLENGHRSISPGWSVLISASMYSLTICQRPTNAEKLSAWFTPLLVKVGLKKPIIKAPANAHTNSR